MANRCQISGKSKQYGHRVSHANNKTKHCFHPNIQEKRIFVPSLNKQVRLKVSTKMIRTIDKLGIEATLKKFDIALGSLI
jgi:large subunit ribosomal protein L28